VLAVAAAVIVVVHHALADPGLLLGDARAHRRDDAAGLVAGDHPGLPLDAPGHGPGRLGRRAIVVQVAAAHARRLDLEDHVSGAWCRIRELPELQLPISEKNDASHGFLRCVSVGVILWSLDGMKAAGLPLDMLAYIAPQEHPADAATQPRAEDVLRRGTLDPHAAAPLEPQAQLHRARGRLPAP